MQMWKHMAGLRLSA
jgi:hypothetical protein